MPERPTAAFVLSLMGGIAILLVALVIPAARAAILTMRTPPFGGRVLAGTGILGGSSLGVSSFWVA